MNNNDYKTDFEEQRKEIDITTDNEPLLTSRVERHSKRKVKKTSSHTMINIILGVFAFIPIVIFAFVIYNFYFGSDSGSANDNTGVQMDISPGKTAGSISSAVDSEQGEETTEQKENEEKNDASIETGKPPVSVNSSTTEKVEVSNSNGKGDTESKKPAAKPEAKPQPKPEAKPEKKPETKPESKPVTNPQSATHIVSANETLYRISMNYYGSDTGVEKIKKANGLSSNDIMAGQKLIIPK